MRRPFICAALAAGLFLTGCGQPKTASGSGASDEQLISYGQTQVRGKLRDPASAVFEDIKVSRRAGVPAICGYVNSKNGLGGMSGRQRFISGGATVLEEEMAAGEMDTAWNQLC